ncbi:YciE/YciF ferroxidase family protein [Flavitalea flava]
METTIAKNPNFAKSTGNEMATGNEGNTTGKEVTRNSKLQEFFIDQLEDIYWAEQKLVKTLPKLEESAHSQELKQAFNNHLQETKNHVTRLEKIFELIGEPAQAKKCHAIAGIIDEGEDIIDETEENTAQRDVGLIFAGQKAEHYEIATYGGLVQLARTLGYTDAAELLGVTLAEEKKADITLTEIAETSVNVQASKEPRKN